MTNIFHHDTIMILSNNELVQDRLAYELSNNDGEVIQAYSLHELEKRINENPILTLVIYLDSLNPKIFDLDLYREYSDQFSIIIINCLGKECPFIQLEEIPFLTIIDEQEEEMVYDINLFLDGLYGYDQAA